MKLLSTPLKATSYLTLLTLCWSPIHAESQDYYAESDFFGESPVVLTVSRMHKPLAESPASVTVIDRQMIKNSGARQISDIFFMVPGFIVGHNTYNGNKPVVAYQGLGTQFYQQFQILIDGRSVFLPLFGGVPWANLPLLLEDIERVEVTRGPNAVTYGANAFLATINIISRHAAEDTGLAVSYTHDLDHSSKTQDLYVRMGDQVGDLDWRITAGRDTDDGHELFHDSYATNKFNIRTDFLTAYNQFWTIQAGINETASNEGDGDANNIFRDEDSSGSYQNIKWELIDEQLSTTVKLTHTRQDVVDHFETPVLNTFLGIDPSLALPDFTGTVNYDRLSDRIDFEAYQNRALNEQFTLNYGLNLRKDVVKSFYVFHDFETYTMKTQRLFTSAEWKPLQGLTLDLGLTYEDSDFTDRDLSHRLSLIQQLGNHHLRLVTSTANRNPVLWELIGNTQFDIDVPGGITLLIPVWKGNNQLLPEHIKSTEIGLFSHFMERQISMDLRVFTYEITDQARITRSPIPPSTDPNTFYQGASFRTFDNTAFSEVDGIELSVNFSPKHKRYRIYGGASATNAVSNDVQHNNSFPDDTLFVGGHFDITPRHQVSSNLYTVSAFKMRDAPIAIDRYNRIDLRYQFTIDPKSSTRLELIGKNLQDDYDDYGLGRKQESSYLMRVSSRF